MIWILAFLKLLAADSIILSNDCLSVAKTANCRIELETLKGTPGADCPLFSTVQRSCSMYGSAPETSTISPNPGQETDHSVRENGQVTIVTFNASNANGSTSLQGETIWSRPPPGSVQISTVAKSSLPDVDNLPKVVCLCTPSGIDLEAKAPTNQNLAAVLLAGYGSDGSQARLKRAQNDPDPDDNEQMQKHLTEIAAEASQSIQSELAKIEEKPRPKRSGPSNDSEPFSSNDLYEDDIPVQEFHEFRSNPNSNFALTTNISNLVDALPTTPKIENSTRTTSTSSDQHFTGTVTTIKIAENLTTTTSGGQFFSRTVTTMKNAENSTTTRSSGQTFTETVTTTTTTEMPVSPKNENGFHNINDFHDDFHHQTINTEFTTLMTKRVQKREVKAAEGTTTEPGFINWDRRGPRG